MGRSMSFRKFAECLLVGERVSVSSFLSRCPAPLFPGCASVVGVYWRKIRRDRDGFEVWSYFILYVSDSNGV